MSKIATYFDKIDFTPNLMGKKIPYLSTLWFNHHIQSTLRRKFIIQHESPRSVSIPWESNRFFCMCVPPTGCCKWKEFISDQCVSKAKMCLHFSLHSQIPSPIGKLRTVYLVGQCNHLKENFQLAVPCIYHCVLAPPFLQDPWDMLSKFHQQIKVSWWKGLVLIFWFNLNWNRQKRI